MTHNFLNNRRYVRGLLTASRLALNALGDAKQAGRYADLAATLAENFHHEYWEEGHLVDHLNTDGSKDTQVRPNGLLAVLSSPSLFSPDQRGAITEQAAAELVKPWGVLSLNEADPFFHPKHLDLGNYYYDEAYHNGDLWLWLSGAYVSALNDPVTGFGQTRMMLDEILDEGAVGTLQEIRDGARAISNDEFGGATSQAWSLAELLRNVVQDYAGLQVDLTANPPVIVLKPSVPSEWPQLAVRTKIGEQECLIVPGTGDGSGPGLWFKGGVPKEWVFRWQWAQGEPKAGVVEVDTEAPAGWQRRVVWQ